MTEEQAKDIVKSQIRRKLYIAERAGISADTYALICFCDMSTAEEMAAESFEDQLNDLIEDKSDENLERVQRELLTYFKVQREVLSEVEEALGIKAS